ncbi:MAG: hypothetical protein JOY61_17005, partial [Chloroflexi bacterium]|nr:hypothetical protein [Chloroflexota bacterium]
MQLWDLSITQLSRAYRNRSVSPVELVRCLPERIQTLDPTIRAWATLDPDVALAAAARCDAMLSESATDAPPLVGIPFGVKDVLFRPNPKHSCY